MIILNPQQKYVMAILNRTPDSFSDGGKYFDLNQAIDRVFQLEEEGADFIDIGGESTRPGAKSISIEEEVDRVVPLLEKIKNKIKVPISIDTRHAMLAEAALSLGVQIINDVSASEEDVEMIELLKKYPAQYVLMHSRGNPSTMSHLNHYQALVPEILLFLSAKINQMLMQGISKDRFWIDPGIGFAKVGEQNIEILNQLALLKKLGCPILVGLSRKSFLEKYFGPTQNPEERSLGTEVAHTIALINGAQILRVHDVKAARKTIAFINEVMHVA